MKQPRAGYWFDVNSGFRPTAHRAGSQNGITG